MRRVSLMCLVLVCLIWLVGCGSTDDLLVAEVVGKKITGRDLKTALTKQRSFEGTKTALLWISIDKQLLVSEAYDRGLDSNKMILTQLAKERQTRMLKLLKEKLGRRIRVSEVEIQQYYKQQGLDKKQEVRTRHILVRTRQEAEKILEQLKQGADFSQLAKEKSLDTASAERGGDLGYWEQGTVMGATARKIFSMRVGEISEPFQSRGGFHIFEILDRRPVGLEKQKKAIFNRIRHTKSERKFKNYTNKLWKQMDLRVDEQTLTLLLGSTSGKDIPSFTAEERSRVLIGHEGKGITLSEYLEWLGEFRPRRRPDLTDSLQVVTSARGFAHRSLSLPEAFRRKKIEISKQLLSHLQKRKHELMVTELRRLETEAKVLTDEAIREYYENCPDLYIKPPEITVQTVLFDSLNKAQEAFGQIKAGVTMEKVAQKFPSFSKRFQNYDRFSFYVTERDKKILGATVEMAAKTKVGQFKGPYSLSFERGGKRFSAYAILQVLEKQPAGQYSLDERRIRREVVRRLKVEKTMELNKLFQELIARGREKYSPQIILYEEALRALPKLGER